MSGQVDTWTAIKDFFNTVFLSPVVEIYSLIPDSILFGSILLYALTQNLSYGIFSIFIMEVIVSHKLLSWVMTQIDGPQSRSNNDSSSRCRAGFKVSQLNPRGIFEHNQYPSYAIFSMTSIATYLGLSTLEFSDTFEAMGSEWKGRSMTAYIFIAAVLITFLLARRYGCSSETWSEITIAFLFALLTAFAFFRLNIMLFDKESINFLGLPYLSEKVANGAPIYVCSADPSANSSQ
jgi:hypothetical protein